MSSPTSTSPLNTLGHERDELLRKLKAAKKEANTMSANFSRLAEALKDSPEKLARGLSVRWKGKMIDASKLDLAETVRVAQEIEELESELRSKEKQMYRQGWKGSAFLVVSPRRH